MPKTTVAAGPSNAGDESRDEQAEEPKPKGRAKAKTEKGEKDA